MSLGRRRCPEEQHSHRRIESQTLRSPDGLYSSNKVGEWKQDKYDQKPASMVASIEAVITCVKADENAPSGIIFDIRKQLQDIDALKIAYSVTDKGLNNGDTE